MQRTDRISIGWNGLKISPLQHFSLTDQINGMNIGKKYHSGMDLGTDGADHAICQVMFLFYGMTKEQVQKYLPYGIMSLSVKNGM